MEGRPRVSPADILEPRMTQMARISDVLAAWSASSAVRSVHLRGVEERAWSGADWCLGAIYLPAGVFVLEISGVVAFNSEVAGCPVAFWK